MKYLMTTAQLDEIVTLCPRRMPPAKAVLHTAILEVAEGHPEELPVDYRNELIEERIADIVKGYTGVLPSWCMQK